METGGEMSEWGEGKEEVFASRSFELKRSEYVWKQHEKKGVVPGAGKVLQYSLTASNISSLLLLQFSEHQTSAKDC